MPPTQEHFCIFIFYRNNVITVISLKDKTNYKLSPNVFYFILLCFYYKFQGY